MALGKISFDIYGKIEDRWSVYSSSKYRDAEIEETKEFLGSGKDVYNFDARKTTSRVLRKYLDDQGLTAIELLHSYVQIKNLTRNEDFLNKALHTIARA